MSVADHDALKGVMQFRKSQWSNSQNSPQTYMSKSYGQKLRNAIHEHTSIIHKISCRFVMYKSKVFLAFSWSTFHSYKLSHVNLCLELHPKILMKKIGVMAIFSITCQTFCVLVFSWMPSLKRTANAPENRPNPKRETTCSIPTIHFQGLYVGFREGNSPIQHLRHLWLQRPNQDRMVFF